MLPDDIERVFTEHLIDKGHAGFWKHLNSSSKDIISVTEFQDSLEVMGFSGKEEIANLYKKLSDGTVNLTRENIKCHYFSMVPM